MMSGVTLQITLNPMLISSAVVCICRLFQLEKTQIVEQFDKSLSYGYDNEFNWQDR